MSSSEYPAHATLVDPYSEADAEYGVDDHQLSKEGPKRGHKFCGCCCDSRRAVIIVNCFTFVLNVFALTNLIYDRIKSRHVTVDDDTIMHELRHSGMIFTTGMVMVVASACGIFGAKIYNIWLVGIALVVHLLYALRELIELHFLWAILMALFVYPHVVFIREIHRDIMSSETYATREKNWF